jgi:hypothetical protein
VEGHGSALVGLGDAKNGLAADLRGGLDDLQAPRGQQDPADGRAAASPQRSPVYAKTLIRVPYGDQSAVRAGGRGREVGEPAMAQEPVLACVDPRRADTGGWVAGQPASRPALSR